METYEYNGEKYYFKKGKWLKSDYTVAPISVVTELNKLLMENENFEEKSVDEIIKLLDGAKMTSNTGFALKLAEEAMEKASLSEARALLPRITSLYRIKHRPEKAIEVGEHYIGIYEGKIWSPSLFTSLAAAYCDLNELEKARKYANRARAISGNNSSVELMSVYARLKKLEEDSPDIVIRDRSIEQLIDSKNDDSTKSDNLILESHKVIAQKQVVERIGKKTYWDLVDENPNTVVLKKEGWLFRAKDECAHVLSNSLGYNIMNRDNGTEEAGAAQLDVIVGGLKDLHINYLVVHFDEIIERGEFQDNQYSNFIEKNEQYVPIERKRSRESQGVSEIKEEKIVLLQFIDLLQKGVDPITGEIYEDDNFLFSKEMKEILEIAKTKIESQIAPNERKISDSDLNQDGQALYEKLKECRMNMAKELGVPAFTICHNSTLANISQRKPGSKEEMLTVPGVGEKAFEKYGEAFLEIINNHS